MCDCAGLTPLRRDLTAEERAALLQINPEFFAAVIGGKPRVNHCAYLTDVNGKNVVDSVRRIVVPDAVAEEAKKMVAGRGRNFVVVAAAAAG